MFYSPFFSFKISEEDKSIRTKWILQYLLR